MFFLNRRVIENLRFSSEKRGMATRPCEMYKQWLVWVFRYFFQNFFLLHIYSKIQDITLELPIPLKWQIL